MKKALLVIVVVVAGITAGLGLAIGSQLDTDDSTASVGDSSDGAAPEPSATPAPTDAPEPTASDSESDVSEPTETATETRTSIPAREFSEDEIAATLESYVNEERTSQGLDPLATDGRTVDRLSVMATEHSEAMAADGKTIHAAGGLTSAERYEKYDLYETCKFKAVGKPYVVTPDNNDLEALGRTVAGHTYDADGTTKFNADDQAVAQSIFETWMGTTTYRDRLLRDGITRIGIGVDVTDTGYVYVTANTCG